LSRTLAKNFGPQTCTLGKTGSLQLSRLVFSLEISRPSASSATTFNMDMPDIPINVPIDNPNADTEWYIAS
jgi:hypothetical protein